MALHLLQGGLGGETLFILQYAHAGRSGGGGELLRHCPAGALGLHFNKKKKERKKGLTLNTRTFHRVVNLIKFRMQQVIECPRHFELLHSKRIVVNRFTPNSFFFFVLPKNVYLCTLKREVYFPSASLQTRQCSATHPEYKNCKNYESLILSY